MANINAVAILESVKLTVNGVVGRSGVSVDNGPRTRSTPSAEATRAGL